MGAQRTMCGAHTKPTCVNAQGALAVGRLSSQTPCNGDTASPPVSMQKVPSVLGEVSPTLLCPKAATRPAPTSASVPETWVRAQTSISWEATPLLSPLIS